MKQKEEYLKDWLSFRSELENLLTESNIDSNYLFFRECWEWKITPERAVNFLIN